MPNQKLTVKVDTKLCIGAASCVSVAPQFFGLDEDNIAFAIDPVSGEQKSSVTFEADEKQIAAIREAVENCPTSAIEIGK